MMKTNGVLMAAMIVALFAVTIDGNALDLSSSPFLAPSSTLYDDEMTSEENYVQSTPVYSKDEQPAATLENVEYRSAAFDDLSSTLTEQLSSSEIVSERDMLDGLVAQFAASLLNEIEIASSSDFNYVEASTQYSVTASPTPISSLQIPLASPNIGFEVPNDEIKKSSIHESSDKPLPTLITEFRPADLRLKSSPTIISLPPVSPTLNDEDIASSFFNAVLLNPTPTILSLQNEISSTFSSVLPPQSASSVSILPILNLVLQSFTDEKIPTLGEAPADVPQRTASKDAPSSSSPIIAVPTVSAFSTTVISAVPVVSEVLPTVPMVSKVIPAIPAVSKVIPTVSKVIPTVSKVVPTVSKVVPTVSKVVPTVSKVIPTVSKIISTVPIASKVIPAASKIIPTVSKVIPAVSKVIPTVPTASKVSPTVSKIVPAMVHVSKIVAAAVSASKIIPSASSTLLGTSSYLSSVTTARLPVVTDILSVIRPSEAVNYGPSQQPVAVTSPPQSSVLDNHDQVQSQIDKVSEILNIKDLSLIRSNVSDDTVDRIIQGLMDIIRPLNANNQQINPATIGTRFPVQALNKQPLNEIKLNYVAPQSSSSTNRPIVPSQTVSNVFKSSISSSSDIPVSTAIVSSISSQEEHLKTPVLSSLIITEELTTGRQPPETLSPHLSALLANPTPTIIPQIISTFLPIQNFIRPVPTTTRKPPIVTLPTTPTFVRPTFFKLTPKPPVITTFEDDTFAFGEARPILLSLADDQSNVDEASRLPAREPTPIFNSQALNVGSNTVQIKEKPQIVNHQLHQNHLVVNFVSPSPIADFSSTVNFELGKPGGILVKPTLSNFWNGRPSIVPLRDSAAIQTTPLQDNRPSSSQFFITQSSVFIRPTPASSSIHRQTIFHTIVTFSDSSHNDQNAANDDQSINLTKIPSTSTATTTKVPSTTTTTRKPITTTRRPSSVFSTTRRRRRPTTSTTATSASTRRPFRNRRTTTSKRPILRPVHDSVAVTTTTVKPARPGQNLMAFGLSLLPAAVIAAVIGFPLAIAGRKKREVKEKDSDELLAEWERIKSQIATFAHNRR